MGGESHEKDGTLNGAPWLVEKLTKKFGGLTRWGEVCQGGGRNSL